ncbi:Uncharacterised protein [Mycobacteroides abscessus subsp. bolletii]|nr:Uncharacterised protein [Mycobacteroides abscessus subsp. bolletii]
MFRLIWNFSAYTRIILRRFMPTNIALDALRTRRCLKWGVPAALIALPYLFIASFITPPTRQQPHQAAKHEL